MKSIRLDLLKALDSVDKSLTIQSEMQNIIKNSQESLERLEEKISASEKITNCLKSSYQDRIRNLKALVTQLEERLKESIELETSLDDTEKVAVTTLEAQEAGLRFWRMAAISQAVIIVIMVGGYLILK